MKSHIPVDAWNVFSRWKKEAAKYLHHFRYLVQEIVEESKSRTNTKRILISYELAQGGLFWEFPMRVYQHHTQVARQPQGKGTGAFRYDLRDSKDRGNGTIRTLWHGSAGIARHRKTDVLEKWKKTHQELIAESKFSSGALALLIEWLDLKTLVEDLRTSLWNEIERGTFAGGRCDQCP